MSVRRTIGIYVDIYAGRQVWKYLCVFGIKVYRCIGIYVHLSISTVGNRYIGT